MASRKSSGSSLLDNDFFRGFLCGLGVAALFLILAAVI
jgi:hypothetical protein